MAETSIEARMGMSLADLSKLSKKQNVKKKKAKLAEKPKPSFGKSKLKIKLKPKPKATTKKPFAAGKQPKGLTITGVGAAKKPVKFGGKHKPGPAGPGKGKPPTNHPGAKKKVSFKVGGAPSLFSKAGKKKGGKGGIMKPKVSSPVKQPKGAKSKLDKGKAKAKGKKLKQPALFSSSSGAATRATGKQKRNLENVQFRVGGHGPAQGGGEQQLSRRQRKRKAAASVLRFHADTEPYEESPVGGMVQGGHNQGQAGFLRHKSQHHQPTASRTAAIPPDIEQCTVRIRNDLADGPPRSLGPGERLVQPTADDIEMRYPSPKRRRRVLVDGGF